MKKILITGGAGFIGSHLIKNLINENKIICIDNFNDFYNPKIKEKNISPFLSNKNFILFRNDITEPDIFNKIFSVHSDIEIVVHLAARAGVRQSIENPEIYIDTNIKGTYYLLEAMRKYNINKLIFASSSSIYGNNKKIPFSENDRVDNMISPYAITKRTGELLCFNYHHLYKLNVFCLRFFTVYGPSQRPEMAIHYFTDKIFNDKEIPVFGDGLQQRDFTYIDDIIDGVLKAIDKCNSFDIFNLGESQSIELVKVINLIGKYLNKEVKIKYYPANEADVRLTYADISKAKKYLGYSPKTKIEDGLRLFINWYLEQKKIF
ncbi:MAG TPA: NAD-dependent epimerase/dehydratase family protein [bacterium]|nr:NAD-dependent epimerase/dehydratase family protein [bacterium]HOL46638.1 NAD-dependent epimerase/dehydratase family protein [bacterium]HPQ17790.1 NAD-dependent epimerase/dehydratase family protein [bacterium]